MSVTALALQALLCDPEVTLIAERMNDWDEFTRHMDLVGMTMIPDTRYEWIDPHIDVSVMQVALKYVRIPT